VLLECDRVTVAYGQLEAVRSVTIGIDHGDAVTIVGANGAGKTSLVRAISGLEEVASGSVVFDGDEITGKGPATIARRGIGHVPEGRALFPNLTVREQLRLGLYRLGRRAMDAEAPARLQWVFELFPSLAERTGVEARMLSGGEQQMLAIGRALMSQPRVLILDEPSLGLAPKIVETIFESLLRLKEQEGLTVLLIEQNAHLALDFAERAYVLERGEVVESGSTAELRGSERVTEIYLGTGESEVAAGV